MNFESLLFGETGTNFVITFLKYISPKFGMDNN